MAGAGFSLRILLADGDVTGVQFLEVANWTGLGVLVPRDRYNSMRTEPEFSRSGVYILSGPDPEHDDRTRLYVGRADELRSRLDTHAKEKNWWDRCLCFTTSDNSLTLTHIQFLETALIKRARDVGIALLENIQQPSSQTLGRADRHDLTRFLENVLLLAGMVFEYFEVQESDQTTGVLPTGMGQASDWKYAGRVFTYIGAGPYKAKAEYLSPKQFVVKKDSTARKGHVPSCPPALRQLREKLIGENVLIESGEFLRFAEDRAFTSPSLAAGIVYGGAANGRTAWATENGKDINELDEEELVATGQLVKVAVPVEGAG